MHAENIDILDLEASTLELLDHPTQRTASVGARENVLVHEKTPAVVDR
jgi:hypothetical protein